MADGAARGAAHRNNERITVLNDNDVLFGRGIGPSLYVGTTRLRDLCDKRKEEYVNIDSYKLKAQIAKEIVKQIESRGGRFLQLINKTSNVVDEGIWRVVSPKAAQEKVKQCLREQRENDESASSKGGAKGRNDDESRQANETSSAAIESDAVGVQATLSIVRDFPRRLPALPAPFAVPSPTQRRHVSTILPPSMLPSSGPFGVDPRALPLQRNMIHSLELNMLNAHQSELRQQRMMATTNARYASQLANQNNYNYQQAHYNNTIAGDPFRFHPPSVLPQGMGTYRMDRQYLPPVTSAGQQSMPFVPPGVSRESIANNSAQFAASPAPNKASHPQADDTESAIYALSALALAGLPKFTAEQEALERAAMTNEERAAALSDLFGTYCIIDSPKGKRARRDLDSESIAFLVGQMRTELEQIPANKKEASAEAQKKCRAFEFSDKRLEQFLRCEGMNAKLAAYRFVNYWKGRREVFGPEKFTMRMTLSEALKDDLDAIEDGVFSVLPHLDASGRQILYLEPHRRSQGRYSSESLLRSLWYIIECTAQENKDNNSGFVCVTWMKGTTTFDYDRSVYNRFLYFEASCFPVQCIGAHSCCPSSIVLRVLKPILYAIMDKRARSRCRYHAVPEMEILNVLSDYGIFKGHLPIEMGGTVEVDQSEWVSNRRSVELEAIS